jgi:hypothetical protein
LAIVSRKTALKHKRRKAFTERFLGAAANRTKLRSGCAIDQPESQP